jgi:hypothetical protein
MNNDLSASDFDEFASWRYDDISDMYVPVKSLEDLPEDAKDLRIRAKFVFGNGFSASGYVCGVERVFSIALFSGERIFYMNSNLPELSLDQLAEFAVSVGIDLPARALLPVHFSTSWGGVLFNDFSGVFSVG